MIGKCRLPQARIASRNRRSETAQRLRNSFAVPRTFSILIESVIGWTLARLDTIQRSARASTPRTGDELVEELMRKGFFKADGIAHGRSV